jgi:hypothetical protein
MHTIPPLMETLHIRYVEIVGNEDDIKISLLLTVEVLYCETQQAGLVLMK